MAQLSPTTTFDPEYSSPSASAIDWSSGQRALGSAQIFWLATVRPDGRPHVTPLIAVWLDDRLYFATGDEERKAKNLAESAHCIMLTGMNTWNDALDVVVEG